MRMRMRVRVLSNASMQQPISMRLQFASLNTAERLNFRDVYVTHMQCVIESIYRVSSAYS